MTDQNSLKRLVRERMSRTGESYTTARRHVTATAPVDSGSPAQQSGVVDGYPGFGPETHHPSSLVRHLLGAGGIDITEAMACGLGGGIGFMYAVFDYKQVDHPLLTIVAQHHPRPWLSVVAANLGLQLETQHSSTASAARTKLDACLAAGTPALLTVARGPLPHHSGGSMPEAADPHQMIVAGRRGDDYLVDDLAPAPQVIGNADLEAAWAAHRKGRFELTTLVAGSVEQVAKGADDVLPGAVRSAVRTTADHLTGPVLGNSFDVNFGFSGMRKLTTELRDGTTKRGWQRRFATPARMSYACARLSECLTSAYTAPGATRPLYAEFLTQAADLEDAPALAQAAALFDRSGLGWAALAALAAASGTAGGNAGAAHVAGLFSSFADAVEECISLEELGVERLREYVGGQEQAAG